jgi:predicted PurR-regulated permease PerM
MQKPNITSLIFFWIIFAITGIFAYFIFAPYLTPLFLGLVLAIVLQPVYVIRSRNLSGKTTFAALLTTFIAIIAIILPLFVIGSVLTQEVVNAYNVLTQSGGGALVSMTDRVNAFFQHVLPAANIRIDLPSLAGGFLQYIGSNLNAFFISIVSVLFSALLMLFALFFFLRDGSRLRRFVMEWSPLPERYDENILDRLAAAVSAVVKGSLVSAVAQGTAAGVGLAVFGIQGALLWGVIAVFAALIPVVGTALVTVPAALYIIFNGGILSGILLLLYSMIFIGNIDTFLRPYLMHKNLDIHPLVILLSVLGGLSVFGPMGFIAGPVVIALFFVLLDLYPELVRGKVGASEAEV